MSTGERISGTVFNFISVLLFTFDNF